MQGMLKMHQINITLFPFLKRSNLDKILPILNQIEILSQKEYIKNTSGVPLTSSNKLCRSNTTYSLGLFDSFLFPPSLVFGDYV